MATWRCTFTGVIRSLQFGNGVAVTPAAYILIHVYVHIRIHVRVHPYRVFRRRIPRDPSPADPVEKLKDAETENCIRRLTRTPPENSQGARRSRRHVEIRNLNSSTHARPSLSFLLFCDPGAPHPAPPPRNWNIVLIYGDMSARNKQADPPSTHTRASMCINNACARARLSAFHSRALSPSDCNRDSDSFRIIVSIYYVPNASSFYPPRVRGDVRGQSSRGQHRNARDQALTARVHRADIAISLKHTR